jgi:transcription-repair coupling factor (superfamily II helicase)
LNSLRKTFSTPGRIEITGTPAGCDALVLSELAASAAFADIVHIAVDDAAMAHIASALRFFAPDAEVLKMPAWDCLPYDRVSPKSAIEAERIDTLTRLVGARLVGGRAEASRCRITLTTVNAFLQRVPAPETYRDACYSAAKGETIELEALTDFLVNNGYGRAETVMEPGEYAIRGGLIDVFPPGLDQPVRLDLFGDVVEDIRGFDPLTQRSEGSVASFELKPVSEVLLNDATVTRFRENYRDLFGAVTGEDPLYEAVSAKRRHPGMEHWLALFHERLEPLLAYLPDAVVTVAHQADHARDARLEAINDYYQARRDFTASGFAADGAVYHPVPPERLYLLGDEWDRQLAGRAVGFFSPFTSPPTGPRRYDAGGKPGHDFAAARRQTGVQLFDAVTADIKEHKAAGRRVVVAGYSAGSLERLKGLLRDHGAGDGKAVEGWAEVNALPWAEVNALPAATLALAVLDLEHGFVTPKLAFIGEQDILGERLAKPARKAARADRFFSEVSNLALDDLVVHLDHGIGRYDFVPVENIEVLGRYGEDQGTVNLDKLGGAAWQSRKARLKKRIRDMAEELLKVAAQRELSHAEAMTPADALYDEFCARFGFDETDDQQTAITDTINDAASTRPMDRLICGDVGFGKTEVALRAAFMTAMSGAQVAIVVPTTLLARQHYETFSERFSGWPVRIGRISRLVPAKEVAETKQGLAAGTLDIVIGTHGLLSKQVGFANLGLLVVDEEQRFGVVHKERLKRLKSNVHVLTLTATPIPRTLQLALAGVKDMSIIATPPVDRLAVRTFILPFDPVIIREALERERFRGGQTFYVCPRIRDLGAVEEQIERLVPDAKVISVHGRMAPRDLEAAMSSFYEGGADVLLSTNIIESGLDIPNVNTLIVHRADRFGLAELYQLRGRVGRAKVRAYAYLTLPVRQTLTAAAEKRLGVMQTLDSLGAGFSLASHDLDIRGAGNLLGQEQSGHIREVGVELYQHMLEETVAALRGGDDGPGEDWTPQISISMPVLIPESYVADLGVRLGLYRRLAGLVAAVEIEAFAAELIDRFGSLPGEVENLLSIIAIKQLCRDAGVEKVEAGPKGAVLSFRDNHFANLEGLVEFIQAEAGAVKLRPDHRLVCMRDWAKGEARIAGVEHLMRGLAAIARAAEGTPVPTRRSS